MDIVQDKVFSTGVSNHICAVCGLWSIDDGVKDCACLCGLRGGSQRTGDLTH